MQSRRGREKIDSMVVKEKTTEAQEESSIGMKQCSAQRIDRTLDKPVSKVHCFPYKISRLKELFPYQKERL